jgi:hypothetical protein
MADAAKPVARVEAPESSMMSVMSSVDSSTTGTQSSTEHSTPADQAQAL